MTPGNTSTIQTRFLPASWLKDPSSAVQTAVEPLFGKHWSHISLLQTDLWEQPQLDWAVKTWQGPALAVPRQGSCTSPGRNPERDEHAKLSVAPLKHSNNNNNTALWWMQSIKRLRKDSPAWHWWKQLQRRRTYRLPEWCLAPASSSLKACG